MDGGGGVVGIFTVAADAGGEVRGVAVAAVGPVWGAGLGGGGGGGGAFADYLLRGGRGG